MEESSCLRRGVALRSTMTSVEDIVKELDEETVASLVDKMALFDVSRKF